MSNNHNHGYNDPSRKWGYYAVKYLFKIMITIFYSEVEIVGSMKFPIEGPVIVAINHVNSLTDAAITLSSCPRDVRLTCKDNLLTMGGLMSFLIRNVESIPIKRKMDYNNNDNNTNDVNNTTNTQRIDNKESINILLRELGNGCCVGLFPEGLCRYKPQLSQFRTGVARTAIDYVLNTVFNDDDRFKSKYDYIYIVPVGITYLHREMFRSDVSVRINDAIKIDKELLNKYNINIDNKDDVNIKYKMAKEITNILYQSILDSTISSPDWHTICLSHLSRQIAFPESSSPRMGIFCAHYVDLTRKFNKIFIENKENKNISLCLKELDKYWRLLYNHGLKDNRILELQENKKNKISIMLRLFYRGFMALILWGMATPGFILALPLVLSFRIIRNKKVKAGLHNNYDEVAHTKMVAIGTMVPMLTICYTLIITKIFHLKYGKIFALLFPFILWMTMRLSQDGTAHLRSFWSLLKMLFLSNKSRKQLIENRKNCQSLVNNVVTQFNIDYDSQLIDKNDMRMSRSIINTKKKRKISWYKKIIRRLYYGRVKNDWNETIRLYDVPVDEFHLNDKHQQQLKMSYTYK